MTEMAEISDRAPRRADAIITVHETGNPLTGQTFVTCEVRDAMQVIRAVVRRELPGRWATADEKRAATSEAVAQALADPKFATKLDWAYRYRATNSRAARLVAEAEGQSPGLKRG